MGSGNSNTYKMENNDIDSLTNNMGNMNVDIEIQPWIRQMPTRDLQATIREVATTNDYSDNYPGTLSDMEVVTDANRHTYEYNLAVFLTNVQRKHNSIRDRILSMTLTELRQLCRDNNITNYSRMNKGDLQLHLINYFTN